MRHKPIITRILKKIAPITYTENYKNIDKAYQPLIYKGKKISDLLGDIAKRLAPKGLLELIDDLFETLIKKLNHIKLLNYIEKNISDELKLKLGILGMKGDWINEAKLDSEVIQDFIAETGEINEIDNKISSLVATILKSYKHIFLNYGKAFLTDAEIAELYQPNISDEKNYEVYMKVALRFLYGIDKNAFDGKRERLDLLTMKEHNAQVKMQDLTLEIFRCAQSVNYLRACDLEIKLGNYIYALDSTKTLKICKVLYTLKSRNIDNIETTFNYLINAGIDINIVDRYLENCQKIDERQKIEQCFDDFNKSKEIQKTKLMLLANNVKSDKAFERLDVLTKLLQEKQIVEKIARSKDADNLITFIAENIDYANQLFLNGTDDNPELNLFIRFADKPEVLKELNKLKESNEIAYELLSEKEDIDIDTIRGNFGEWAINELEPSNYNSPPDESFQKGNISLAMEKLGSNKDDFSIYEAFEGCRIPDEKFTSIKSAIKEGKNESILGIISDAEEYIARVDIPVGPKGYLATKFKNILLRAFKEIDANKQHYRNKDSKSLLDEFKTTKERNEKIAILRELAYRKTGLYLNHAQLFSVILQNLFGHKVAIGLPTGSGKSLIAAISSILQIDSGRTACITTTNDLLAHEAYKDFRALYSFMGIKTKLLRHYTEAFNPDKHLIIGSIRNLSFLKQKIRLNGISFGNCCILLDEFDDSIIDSNEIYQQSKPDSFLAKEKHRRIFFKMIHDNFKTIFNHAKKEIDDDAIKRLVSKSTISAKDKNKILEFESIDFQILIASYLESNSLEKEKDYAIIDGEIIPIIKNKLQHESNFMYYVQQFLALKNGITIPVITRAGLSDTAADVINSFDCKILMSGTIADDNEWNLIDYPTINLESIKASKRKDCEAISFENHDEYLDHIHTRALILSQKHPVLIFAENGPSADLIYKKFKGKDVAIDTATQKQIKGKTLHGSVTSKSKEILEYANIKGHITIVTPAMSRGIDYKPSVDTGLAVIKTYASSKRLEQQELGRSGRQGAAGHTERILFGSRTSYYIKSNEEIAKKAFNDMQARMLKTYEQNILKHLTHYKKAIDNTSRYEEIKDFKSKIEHKVAQHNIFLKSTFAEHEEKFLNHFKEKYSLPNDNKVANKNLYDLIIGNFEKAMRMEIMSEPLTQEKITEDERQEKITEDERKKIYNSIIGTLSETALIEKYIYEKVKAEVKIEPWYSEKKFDGIVDPRDLDEIREIKQLYKEEEDQFERFLEYKVFSKLYSSEESIEKYKQEYNQKDQIDDKTKIKNYINKIFKYHNVEIPHEFTQLKEKLNGPKNPAKEHFFNICKKAIDESENYDEFYSNCMELTAEQMPQFRKIKPKKQENNYNSITRALIFPQIEDYLKRMQIKEVSNKTVTLEDKENKEIKIKIEIDNELIGKLIGWLCKGKYKKATEYYLDLYENKNELINGLVEKLLLKIEKKPESSEKILENKNELYEKEPKNVENIDFCTYKAIEKIEHKAAETDNKSNTSEEILEKEPEKVENRELKTTEIEKVKNKRKWVFFTAMSIIFASASFTIKLYEPMIAGLEAKLASISNDYYTYILIFGALCSLSTIYFIYKTFKVYYYNKKIDQPTQLNQSNGTDANNFLQPVRTMQGQKNITSGITDKNKTQNSI